ncbi:four helix bundle protein [Calditrichota bacterium]
MEPKKFAHRCVKMALALPNSPLGKHVRGQLIRCSTSVASNYRATCLSQSKPSFVAKISIVIEECDESSYWMEFIIDENLMKKELIEDLLIESKELTSIFISSRKTAGRRKF